MEAISRGRSRPGQGHARRRGVWIGAALLYNQLITFGFGIAIGRWLGAGDFGVFSALKSLFTIALVVAPLGFDISLQRYVGSGQLAGLRMLRPIRVVCAIVSTFMAIAVLPWIAALDESAITEGATIWWLILAFFLALPFGADLSVLGGYYRGLKKPLLQVIATAVVQPTVRMILTVALLLLDWGLAAVILAWTLSTMLSWMALLVRSQSDRDASETSAHGSASGGGSLFSQSLVMSLSLILVVIMRQTDLIVLNYSVSPEQIGNYAAVMTMCSGIAIAASVVGQTLGAQVAELYAGGQAGLICHEIRRNISSILILSSPIYSAVVWWGGDVGLLLGDTFKPSAALVLLLASSQFIWSASACVGFALSMTGRSRVEAAVIMGGVLINIAFQVPFVDKWGAVGAAIAGLISVCSVNMVRLLVVRSLFGSGIMSGAMLMYPALAISVGFVTRGLFKEPDTLWELVLGATSNVALCFLAAFLMFRPVRDLVRGVVAAPSSVIEEQRS